MEDELQKVKISAVGYKERNLLYIRGVSAMKVIDVSWESTEMRAILAEAREKNIILRTEDGLAFIVAEIDEFNVEIELTRQNSELMEFLEERARSTKTVSAAEARGRLGL